MSGLVDGADTPEVSMLLRMFSTEVADKEEQLFHALSKHNGSGVAVQLSNTFGGKSTKLLHPDQAFRRVFALLKFKAGKLVSDVSLIQVDTNCVP